MLIDFVRSQHTGVLSYRYAGLGQPVIEADVQQYWDDFRAVGTLAGAGGVILHLLL